MTQHSITDLDRITQALGPSNPIEHMLWDELDQPHAWASIGQIIDQLETASCSAGSWNQMIYTHDIESKLSDPDWRTAINEAIADWRDNTGENPDFPDLASMVTFAVDHTAFQLACRLRHRIGLVAVVIAASDSMDPWPDVIAFDTAWEAEDWVEEEVARRVQHRVDHSPYTVSEDELEQWHEEELELFRIEEERL